ncbi:MAG: stalk domain-containing protein, partial [Peptoniphilus sp.]|nr:stalk domain-containing protein [Peptoniphilus sp.]
SQNTALGELLCTDNQLTELDLSNNADLERVFCYNNQLSELKVSGSEALKKLYCHENQLTELDLSDNAALVELYCYDNQLTELDLSNNTALKKLFCDNNHLTSLDLSNNDSITGVSGGGQEYTIEVDADRTFDLTTLPAGFDVSKASEWSGGTVEDTTLTIDSAETTEVTYEYKVKEIPGNSEDQYIIEVTLKIKNPVTITFDANGGSGTMVPVRVNKGDSYTLPRCEFTPPSIFKKFKAWEVEGVEYAAGRRITIMGDTTVKALWEIPGGNVPKPTPDYKPNYPEQDYIPRVRPDFRPLEPKNPYKQVEEIKIEIELTIGSKTLGKEVKAMNNEIKMDVVPYIKDGRTMLPIRFIAEALGFKVEWIEETRTVVLKDRDYRVEIPVDTNKIIVNGVTYESDVKPEIKDDRTMLPVANVARALGMKDGEEIRWDGVQQKVTLVRTITVK